MSKRADEHQSFMQNLTTALGNNNNVSLRQRSNIPVVKEVEGLRKSALQDLEDERARSQTLEEQRDALQRELEKLQHASDAGPLDPKRIRHGRFRDRVEAAFADTAFEQLRSDIAASKGNTVPILVRPTSDDPNAAYEVVYGHRRHRACLELDLPVLALVRELDDRSAVLLMDAENADRSDLSPYELSLKYARWLEDGLFSGQEELAVAINRSQGLVSRYLAFRELPEEVLRAFHDPRELTVRGIAELRAALKERRSEILKRAKALIEGKGRVLPTAEVLRELLKKPEAAKSQLRTFKVGSQKMFEATNDRQGKIILKIPREMSEIQLKTLAEALASIMSES